MNFLNEDLFKIKTVDHSKIQAWIKRYFYNLGYYSRTEKEVWRSRKGRIDVFAQKGSYTVGIEVDHSSIRLNSIEKLNALEPSFDLYPKKWTRKCPFFVFKKQIRYINNQSHEQKNIHPRTN